VGVDLAAFYNDHDHLRTAETYAVLPGLPSLTLRALDNGMEGEGWGFEVGGSWSVTDFCRLRLDYTFTRLDLHLKSGSNDPDAADLEDRTPHHQVALRSRLNLPWRLSFDSALAWVAGLDEGDVDDYVRLDTRLAWRPAQLSNLELSLVGLNLVQEHREFGDGLLTQASKVPRSVYAAVGWSY
jgi:iron complex outermembrane receptor protein